MKVAHVSTFPDMRCGIAFYVSDLIEALPTFEHRKYALHYGKNLTDDAVSHADVSHPSTLQDLARAISQSSCDVVSLQHEFGIWGGVNGEYILYFLDEITKPLVSTLHTTFKSYNRPTVQSSILRRLVERSAVSFVLTQNSRDTLCTALELPQDAVSVIPHGVPNISFVSPSFTRPHGSGNPQTWKLCSIGFFRPDKGLEETLKALSILKRLGYDFQYVIAGSPQPQFIGQEEYVRKLHKLIAELRLVDAVRIEARFLTRAEQVKLIQDTHAGIFAYQDPDHASSGTIPLVMATGRPVICTPFEFALAKKLEIGEGVTVAKDFSSTAIAEALTHLFCSTPDYVPSAMRLHARTRHWIWQAVGPTYATAFDKACTY